MTDSCVYIHTYACSADGKPLSKKALKKLQKDAEKSKRKAETATKLVSLRDIILTRDM